MKQEDQEGEKKGKNQPNIRSYFKKLNKSAEKKEEQQNGEKKTKIRAGIKTTSLPSLEKGKNQPKEREKVNLMRLARKVEREVL